MSEVINRTPSAPLTAQAGTQPSDWPAADREALGYCPVCRSPRAQVLHDGIRDQIFGAPGAWTLQSCVDCGVSYLDPRPTRESIGAAYSSYYTHEQAPRSGAARIVSRFAAATSRRLTELRDGLYITFVWPDKSPSGRVLRPIFEACAPRPLTAIACKLRHLQPAQGHDVRLLDIGCGNGSFLPLAERLGYVAVGMEPDSRAASQGIAQGRDVRCGSLEAHDLPLGSFDHITLAHVLEHFHDPISALDEVRRLLRPGGRIWINQPNLGALGHTEYGRHWRGLEPPRHMVLMTPARLLEILHDRGFVRGELKKPPYEAAHYYSRSALIRDQGAGTGWTSDDVAKARKADIQAFANPMVAESMTAVAYRPW